MAKNEKELFEAPVENKIEEGAAKMENQEMEMEMELELDGEQIQNEMEELVAEKIKKEEKENKEQKSKRGPKPNSKKDKVIDEKEKPEKKEKALDLKDQNIIQREIKKGRLAAPQGRIEKTEAGDYIMKLADGVILPRDAQDNLKEVSRISKMNDGKYVLTKHAADSLKTDKFKAIHENGEEVEHDYVRVELHKPGRDKDVVELYTVRAAKDFLKIKDAQTKKKEEDAKKKEEKAKEKAAKEKEEKENKKEETKA